MKPGLTADELTELAGRMTLKQRVLGINVDLKGHNAVQGTFRFVC